MAHIHWTQEAMSFAGGRERGFTVERHGQVIPGVLWSPSPLSGARPLVLMGHGGSGHKRNERMQMLGRMFTVDYGWCAAAIDGPMHGERGPVTEASDPAYREMWRRPDIVQSMVDDWRTTLDALRQLQEVDSARIGYWGMSMGTMFGLPYVASDHRVRAAVLGKAGMSGPSVERSGIDTYFKTLAPRVTVPVLFVMQWDDERFERQGQLQLFDCLGARDKRLHAYPGQHIDNGPEAFEVQAGFLKRYLERAPQLADIYNFLLHADGTGTAGQPTAEQLATVKDAGYEVVINLATGATPRDLPNEAGVVSELGLEYVHIPVAWEAPTTTDLARFFDAMDHHRDRKRFVHCIANMRVSAFMFLYRVLRQGAPVTDAQATLHQIFQPNPTWQLFIEEALTQKQS